MPKTKEAKILQFKVAFLKPKTPSKEATKMKTNLEKAVKNATKDGTKGDTAKSLLTSLGARLFNEDQDYYIELLSYKLTKHWDEPHDFEMWSDKAAHSHESVATALDKMMGKNPSEELVVECLRRLPKNTPVVDLLFQKAPDRMLKDGVEHVLTKNDKPPGDSAKFQSRVALELFKQGKRDEIPATMDVCLQPNDAAEMAELDPRAFCKRFLENAKTTTKLSLLKNPRVREAVAKNAEDWKNLTAGALVLPFFDSVRAKVDSKKVSKDKVEAETIEAVFDELLADGNDLGMTYFTNVFTPAPMMMGGTKEEIRNKIDENHNKGEKDKMPDQPAAQCDELVSVLKYVMEGALGPDSGVKCKHIVIPGMVLTVPINTLPGGLLKNTFGGNVYNDANVLTKQVLFTGNDFGDDPDAHTYLDVGGVLYDAVLGTKGKAVTDAVAEEFGQWDKSGWESKTYPGTAIYVAKSKSTGNYIVREANPEGALKAATNSSGFSTAYRITTDLAKYATKKPEPPKPDGKKKK